MSLAPGSLAALARLLAGGDAGPLREMEAGPLVDLARRQAVVPLAAAAARRSEFPDHLTSALQDEAGDIARQNLYRATVLVTLLSEMKARGAGGLAYKGPALSQLVHGSVATRQFVDLDILVPRGQLDAATAGVLDAGFEPLIRLEAGRQLRLRADAELGFQRPADGVLVELHWRPFPRTFAVELPVGALLLRAVDVVVAGASVPTLSPEDALLTTWIHGAKHQWEELGMVVDADRLARLSGVDVLAVVDQATALGARRMALLGLRLGRDLCETPVPAALAAELEHPALRRLAATAYTAMGAEISAQAEPGGPVEWPFHLRARERASDRTRYLVRNLVMPTAKDWAMVSLPPRLRALYYPLRLARLAVRYISRPLRRPAGGVP